MRSKKRPKRGPGAVKKPKEIMDQVNQGAAEDPRPIPATAAPLPEVCIPAAVEMAQTDTSHDLLACEDYTPVGSPFAQVLRNPLRLAEGVTLQDVQEATEALAAKLAPIEMPGLVLKRVDGFLALIPEGDEADFAGLEAEVVNAISHLRAPFYEGELTPKAAPRNLAKLSPRHRQLMEQWGYRYKMAAFRLHLTLRGDRPVARRLGPDQILTPWIAAIWPRPFRVEDLSVFQRGKDGSYRLLYPYSLKGG